MAEEASSKSTPPFGGNADRQGPGNGSFSMSSQPSSNSSSTATSLSRSGTLSWQQRPSSRGTVSGRSRPLSMVASENNAARSPRASVEPASVKDDATSRSEIAQTLGAKDPAFFRQTQDRGLGSAAYRKNQTEDVTDIVSAGETKPLPGMSRETSIEGERPSISPAGGTPWSPPSREGSVRGGLRSTARFTNSASTNSLRSPLPTLDSQRFEPPSSDTSSSYGADSISSSRTLAMSPSQGRMTAERTDRPPSPTKGLGGFVQSAMLKRSDSVNKRWSAQASPGLSRGNSIVSNRSGYDGSRQTVSSVAPLQDFKPYSASRETSPISSSRPGSAHGDLTKSLPSESNDHAARNTHIVASDPSSTLAHASVKSELPLGRESSPVSKLGKDRIGDEDVERTLPSSPSKRWSPSKSSWLENAINKPESSKPKAAPPQQPPWMHDLNKAKQRGSVDLGKGTNFKEISTGGLMRSPPPGGLSTAPSFGGLPAGFSSGVSGKPDTQTPSGPEHTQSSNDKEINNTKSSPHSKTDISDAESPTRSDGAGVNQQGPVATPKPLPKKSSPSKTAPGNRSSPSAKPKPETPPKKDFTSNLKARKVSEEKDSKVEPEFKNVFGKLKKTQTQNYVAPDELKGNILRGKAGLATTGGPKKSERKDEFKESILQKKDTMKAGLPSASTTITNASKNHDTSMPEALMRRQGLTRSNSNIKGLESSENKASQPIAPTMQSATSESVKTRSIESQKQPATNAKLGGNFNASLSGILSRGPSPMKSAPNDNPTQHLISTTDQDSSPKMAQTSSGAPQLSHMTKGRARGPKRRLPTAVEPNTTTSSVSPSFPTSTETERVASNPPGRKGCKPDRITSPVLKAEDIRPLSNISNNNRKISQPTSPRKPSTSIMSPLEVKPQSSITHPSPLEAIQKAASPPPVIKQTPTVDTNVKKPRKPSVSVKPPKETGAQTPTSYVALPDTKQKILDVDTAQERLPRDSVNIAASIWQQPSSFQRNGARSPNRLLTRKDEEDVHEKAGLRKSSPSTSIGLGIETAPQKAQSPTPFARNLPTPPSLSPRSPKSPPLPSKKPSLIAPRKPSSTIPSKPLPSNKSSPTSEAARTISDFFNDTTKSTIRFNIDTQTILSTCSSHQGPEKIKTLRKQIFEVASDGKMLPVPSHQEHILFEENLYICTHVFGGLSGTRTTEVYLWSGDCVPASAVEDAQLFARKVAKDNNGKLVILKQGKETSSFFQALGGIVITRRGSSIRGSASYMLCARRHVGQIAFDEVDLSPTTLCKGFSYIISTRFNKLYLWKGSGSGADELGCARLIGMDLGLTGEVEEVDEGQEPPSFWQAFPQDGGKQHANEDAQYWHLKARCETYTTRLFSINAELPRPKSNSGYLSWGRRGSATTSEDDGSMIAAIKETMPFAQADLADEGVYVLDTYFEIFVLVYSYPEVRTLANNNTARSPQAPSRFFLAFAPRSFSPRNMVSSSPPPKTAHSSPPAP